MGLIDIIIEVVVSIFSVTPFDKKKNYRLIDYIIFGIISFIVILIIYGKIDVTIIILGILSSLIISTVLGNISNMIIKKK